MDDEEDLREILSHILKSKGMRVHSAENGRIALDMCQANIFDLVISDINMPIMNGFTLFDSLEQQKGVNRPKFMFVTGGFDASKEEKFRFYQNKSEGTLDKPYSKTVIANKICELFPEKILQAK